MVVPCLFLCCILVVFLGAVYFIVVKPFLRHALRAQQGVRGFRDGHLLVKAPQPRIVAENVSDSYVSLSVLFELWPNRTDSIVVLQPLVVDALCNAEGGHVFRT